MTEKKMGIEDLEKLSNLKEKGIITEEEFNKTKKKLLGLDNNTMEQKEETPPKIKKSTEINKKETTEKKPWYKKLKWWHWAIIISIFFSLLLSISDNQEQSATKHTLPILEEEVQNWTISSYKCKNKCDDEVTVYIKDMKDWAVDGVITYWWFARYIILQRLKWDRKAYHELDWFTINIMSWSELLWSCNYSDTSWNWVKTINCPDWPQRSIAWK